jgi:hypothetical protein
MSTLLVPLCAALLLTMLLSRSLTAWAREPVRWWPLVLLVIGAELVLVRIPVTQVPWLVDNGHWLWLGTLLAIAAVLMRNSLARGTWQRAPWLIATLGTALNLAVILANGGYMPIDPAAFESSGGAAEMADRPRYRRDVPLSSETRLAALADVLLAPDWLPRRGVVSIGDLLLVAGLSGWLLGTVVPTRRPGARLALAA